MGTCSWFEMWEGEGLTFFHFYVLSLAQNDPGRSFCFTMDNLNFHNNQIILPMITDSGYLSGFGAPYWSCGTIKYICTIHAFWKH